MPSRRETGGDFSAQYDELRLEPAAAYVDQEHRAGRRAPPLSGAAGIEDPDTAHALGLRDVRMSIDDRIGARETSRQAPRAPGPWARRVHASRSAPARRRQHGFRAEGGAAPARRRSR